MNELIAVLVPASSEPANLDRFRGVMLGMAVGNALGIGVEG